MRLFQCELTAVFQFVSHECQSFYPPVSVHQTHCVSSQMYELVKRSWSFFQFHLLTHWRGGQWHC